MATGPQPCFGEEITRWPMERISMAIWRNPPCTLLLNGHPEPRGFEDSFLARVQAYTIGYDRELRFVSHLSTAVGGQVTLYNKPQFLTPLYGAHPAGVVLFVRVRTE